MKVILLNNEKYYAEKVIKTSNSITGFIGDNEVFKFEGISDFSIFKLTNEEGQEVDFDKSNEQILREKNDVLIKNIANLILENKKKDAIATTLAQTVATLNLRLNKLEKEGKQYV